MYKYIKFHEYDQNKAEYKSVQEEIVNLNIKA